MTLTVLIARQIANLLRSRRSEVVSAKPRSLEDGTLTVQRNGRENDREARDQVGNVLPNQTGADSIDEIRRLRDQSKPD